MIFGLFESKEAKFWRDETNRTLNDARQRFDASERKKISINVLKRILQTLKDIENLDQKTKKEIMFELIDEVAKKRRNNIKLPKFNNQTPWQEISRKMVGQLETGGCLETDTVFLDITNTKGIPRHSH